LHKFSNRKKIVPIVSVQNRYSVTDRGSEDVLKFCEQQNIGFIPWFPLAAGKLSAAASALNRDAEEIGVSPSQLALAWLLWRSPVMLPIPGTSRVDHLEENVATASLKVPEATLQQLANLG